MYLCIQSKPSLQEFNVKDIVEYARKFASVAQEVFASLSNSITQFQDLITSFNGDRTLGEIFEELKEALGKIPNIVVKLPNDLKPWLDKIQPLTKHIPVLQRVEKIIKRVLQIFIDIKKDFEELHDVRMINVFL